MVQLATWAVDLSLSSNTSSLPRSPPPPSTSRRRLPPVYRHRSGVGRVSRAIKQRASTSPPTGEADDVDVLRNKRIFALGAGQLRRCFSQHLWTKGQDERVAIVPLHPTV